MIPQGTEIFFACLCGASLFAVWLGRVPERVVGVAVFVAWIATGLVHSLDWTKPQYGIAAVDVGLMALLAFLAIRTSRRWLIFAAAFQLLSIGAHVGMAIDVSIRSYAYQTAMAIWGYAVLLALVLGTLFEAMPERRRRRVSGASG